MEAWLLASDSLHKYGVFWSQLASDIEYFHMNVVTTTYVYGEIAVVKAEG